MRFTIFRIGATAIIATLSMFIMTFPCVSPGYGQEVKTQISYEEAMIRWTYLKLTYYNSIANKEKARINNHVYNSRQDISFEVQNVQTGPITEAHNKEINDLMSDPSGSIVSLSPYSQTLNGDEQERIAYTAEWTQGQYATTVAPKNLNLLNLLQILGEKYSDVGKYSTYEVTVKLGGISKKYKAIVIYHSHFQSLEDIKPEFWDTVVGLGGIITDIWNETRPPIGATNKDNRKPSNIRDDKSTNKEPKAPQSLKPFGCDSNQALCCTWGAKSLSECKWNIAYPWNEPKYSAFYRNGNLDNESNNRILFNVGNDMTQLTNLVSSCNYQDQTLAFPSLTGPAGAQEHDSGHHSAHTEVSFRCKMTPSCVATCEPSLRQNATFEDAAGVTYTLGLYQPYHVPRKQPAIEPGSASGASVTSVSCKGGSGYAFKSCLFSGCTVNLSVAWSGLTLTANSSDLWSTAHSRNHTCNFSDGTGGNTGGGNVSFQTCNIPPISGFCDRDRFVSAEGGLCCRATPIIIDISRYWDWAPNSGNGYHFTDVAGGVRFDLNGDGIKEQTAWPTATSENAWLSLDRNGNGLIDSGKELFGNFTDQVGPAGQHIPIGQGNGWQALAELDRGRSGGNENGMVDREDAWFPNLRLWIDRNHNGISEPSELITLGSIGLTGIELTYDSQTGWTDQYGNGFTAIFP